MTADNASLNKPLVPHSSTVRFANSNKQSISFLALDEGTLTEWCCISHRCSALVSVRRRAPDPLYVTRCGFCASQRAVKGFSSWVYTIFRNKVWLLTCLYSTIFLLFLYFRMLNLISAVLLSFDQPDYILPVYAFEDRQT